MNKWQKQLGAIKALLIVLVITSAYFYWDKQRSFAVYEKNTKQKLGQRAQSLARVVKDAVIQVSTTASTLTQDKISDQELKLLSEDFTVTMALNPNLNNIRLLDAQGVERMHLVATQQGPQLLSSEQLTDESKAAFFINSKDLPPRSVYLSSLTVDELKANYRVAAPVRNANGDLIAVFVINLNMNIVLDRLTQVGSSNQFLLLDNQGYLLAGGEVSHLWGKTLEGHQHFSTLHPELWAAIQHKNMQQFEESGHYFYSLMLTPDSLFSQAGEFAPRLLASYETQFYLLSQVSKTKLLSPVLQRTALLFVSLALWAMIWVRYNTARQHEIENKRREHQHTQRLGSLLHHSSELVLTTNENCEIDYVNNALCEVSGYRADELIGKTPAIFRSGYHDDAYYDRLWETLNRGEAFHGLFVNARRDGTQYHEQKTIWPEYDEQGKVTGYVSLGKDISDTRTMRLAFRDDLTGLYNRAMLIDRLRYLMSLSKRQPISMALFYLDLDGFKHTNDVYGHRVGDDVLKQTADKLRHIFRESDTLARMGGDEFVIVTQNVGAADAGMLAQKCIDAMATEWRVNDQALEGLSASVGVALFQSGDETDIAELINHADGAMYRAKNNGKNRYFIYR